jgi:putative nucleotidyltransferase with HDIG domain
MNRSESRIAVVAVAPDVVARCIEDIRHIATLPAVAHQIMRLANDPKTTVRHLKPVISGDPALCTRMLKIVNSSYYGLPQQVASIDLAVGLLGINAVRNVAVAASLHRLFRNRMPYSDFDARDLWVHSIAVAVGARALAEKSGLVSGDEAFLAGLVHDIGILAEVQAMPQKFAEMAKMLSRERGLLFREAERRVLSATHESFGAALCRKWNFPAQIVCAAGFHHDPMQLPRSERALPAIVHVADILAARTSLGYSRTVEFETAPLPVLDASGLSAGDIDAVAETLAGVVHEAQQVLSG